MKSTRRSFLTSTPALSAAGLTAAASSTTGMAPAAGEDPNPFFKLFPIGKVEKEGDAVRLRIFEDYADGLLGLENWSHLNVIYWFDQNDTPPKRRILQVHPRGNPENPLTGVFACRSPVRPNLLALSVCKILSIEGTRVRVDALDALDGSPVLDLKPFIPPDAPAQGLRVPAWAGPNPAPARP